MRPGILAVVAVSAVVLNGCGTETSADSFAAEPAGPGPEYVIELPAEQHQVTESVRAHYEAWAGSVHDHQARQVIQAYADNADEDQCILARIENSPDLAKYVGSRWVDFRAAITGVSLQAHYMAAPGAMPPIHNFTFDDQINAAATRLEAARDQSAPDPIDKISGECSFEVDSSGPLLEHLSDDELDALLRPPSIDALQAAWHKAFGKEIGAIVAREETASCLAKQTVDDPLAAIPPGTGGMGWLEAVSSAVPSDATKIGTSDPAWTNALAMEEQFVKALWACSEGTYDEVLTALQSFVDTFEAEHPGQIAEAEQTWTEVRSVAADLGWSPEDPLAGFTG